MGTDLITFKSLLSNKGTFDTDHEWIAYVNSEFDKLIKPSDMPSRDEIFAYLIDGRPGGALQAALMLPMIARSVVDIAGNKLIGDTDTRTEIHHIFPTRWCRENASGELFDILSRAGEGPNYPDSISNLMPISSEVNGEWSSKSPATYITNKGLMYVGDVAAALSHSFIDQQGFDFLRKGPGAMEEFWRHRAELIADHMIELASL